MLIFIPRNHRAQGLVAAIVIMLILSLFALVGVSLLGTQTGQSAVGLLQSTQALYLAHAGLEWYLQQLADDSNWADQIEPTPHTLGTGSFEIELSNISSTSIVIKSIGKVVGPDGKNRERYIQVTAKKLPPAFKFAVYWGRDTGSSLQIMNNSRIIGDLWSRGRTQIQAGSSVTDGIAYYATGGDITGGGSYTKKEISSPPEMPQIDTSYYNNLISFFDSQISGSGPLNQNRDLELNGNIIRCGTFVTNGNITISGYGYIIASQDILLHSNATSGTLTIAPSGGNIYFLAGENLTVNSTGNRRTNVIINSGAYLYSGDLNSLDRSVTIQKHSSTNTNIDSAFIIGKRRIFIQGGVQITNSTLYVSNVPGLNNYLTIKDNGTTVSGSIISVSDDNPGLVIDSGTTVTGLVYHYGATTGRTTITNTNITGSLVASQFYRDFIRGSTITYSPTSLPSPLPEGFNGYVLVEENSFDGL